jgi:hypothetical protein
MGLISDIATQINTSLVDYVELVFTAVAEPIRTLLQAGALVALMFMAVNHITQWRPVNYSMYLNWGLRYILIYSFATMWVNFEVVYKLVEGIPNDYSTLLVDAVADNLAVRSHRTDILDPGRIHDTYSAMDEFGHAIVWIAWDFIRDTSILDIGKSLKNIFLGALILIIGGIFLAAACIIVLVAKIGFMLAISLAPLALAMLMTEQTKPYFESWSRFTVGYAVIMLLTAGLMAIVLYMAGEILTTNAGSSQNKDGYFPFIFVMIASLVLLFQIPTMASTLSSASVAAVGAGAAFAVSRMINQNFSRVYSGMQRARGGLDAARQAKKSGASPGKAAWSAIQSMRQSSMQRQARRDERIGKRIAGTQSPGFKPRYHEAGGSSGGGSGSGSSSGHKDSAEQQNLNRR